MNAEQIFHEAVEISDPKERVAYLDRVCKENDKLRAAVEALLHADAAAGDFLESPAVDADATLDDSPLIEGPGTKIGRYELLELIGEGGMGLVYLAEQKRPVKRRVALKIIKPGMDSKQVIARFEAERQALAVLDHPNIAHVFDAGTTKAGRPYFVMEHVKGMSITAYCDERKLSIEQRLRLFEQVCEGVHHAHQKGIIHRDLKPSNVLVSVHGERAVPKIIDFGIAKAITQPLTEKTFVTFQGQLLGTPEYMSSEQVDLATQDIDTRSDIYSLGIVLYELLAGILPFESDSFRKAGFAEVQKTIREQEATPPSTRLSSLGEEAKEIAKSRRTQVVTLARCLHRELEWIPLMAMRKDRTRRYRSASELADDIKNYLEGAPLIAGPESTTYRVKKFVHKHAGSVATVALVAVAIILGLVVSTAMYFKAEEARQKAILARTEAEDAKDKEATERIRAEEAEKVAEEQRSLAEKKAEAYRHQSYNYGVALADAKYREADMRGVRQLLDRSPEDLRGWEWYRLNHVSDQSMKTLHAHKGHGVSWVSFSPDGKLMASCGGDCLIRIWDSQTGSELKSLRGHTNYITALAFSPDGKRIVSGGGDRTVRLWDVTDAKELMVLRGHENLVYSVAFSPDRKRVASGGAGDGTVRVWDAISGDLLAVLRSRDMWAMSMAFSPDGKRVASAGADTSIKLWDIVTGKLMTLPEEDNNLLSCVAFSPDGQYIISGGWDGTVRVINTVNGKKFMTMRGHRGIVRHVEFSRDGGRIVSCADDNTIRIWDADTGSELMVLRGHEGSIRCMAFSPDGNRIVSCSEDSEIKLWDAHIDFTRTVMRGHRGDVLGLAFTPNSKQLVSCGSDGTIKLWDALAGAEVLTLGKHESGVVAVAVCPDGTRVASGGWDKTIKLWDLSGGQELMTLHGHDKAVLALTFSPDGSRIVSGSWDRTIKVWDAADGDELITLHGQHQVAVYSVVVSPDGKRIASGGMGDVRVWDMATGNELMVLQGHSDYVSSIAFSPDNKQIISGDWDGKVKVWDATTGDELISLDEHGGGVASAVFTRDGRRIISSSQGGDIKVWDVTSGDELMLISGRTGVREGAFSPNEQIFATSCLDGSIVLWQRDASPEQYRLRQTTKQAETVVDTLYSEHGSYHEVVKELNKDVTLEEPVSQWAMQIARAHCGEDAAKLNERSWEVVSLSDQESAKYQVALEKAEKASRLEPNDPSVIKTLGIAQYRMSFYEAALETLNQTEAVREASGADPDPVSVAFIAMACYKLGRPEAAKKAIRQLHQLSGHGEYDNAYEIRDCLIEAEMLLAGENSKLASIWEDIRLSRIDEAAQAMKEMLSAADTDIVSLTEGAVQWLGREYHRRGKKRNNGGRVDPTVIADFEVALDINPNNAPALNDLAWLRATCTANEHRDAERAVTLATRACELANWDNHEYASTLAAACSESGDFESACKWQRQSISLLPEYCPTDLRADYEVRLKVYEAQKPYHIGSLWSFSDGELIAHWNFDEAEGNRVLNSVKNTLNGQLIGSAQIVSDPERGEVLSLSSKDDYMECDHDPALNITGSLTVSGWIKAKISEESWRINIERSTWWFLSDQEKDTTEFGGTFTGGTEWDADRWISAVGSLDLKDGKWHHFAGISDGQQVLLYVDGTLSSSEDFGGKMATGTSPVRIGGKNSLIDDVRIYSYALNPEEVKMLYEGKEPPREKRSED